MLGDQNLEELSFHGFDVAHDLVERELLSGFALAARVADLGSEVADDDAAGVTKALEVADFPKNDGPTEGDVFGGRVKA